MQKIWLLDDLPIWGVFVCTCLLVLASIEIGHQVGLYRNRSEHEKEGSVGGMVGTTLGLFAFILAFTFGLSASRYDSRRQTVLDEANALGTLYLRADLLPEQRDEIRALIRQYVDVRLEAVRSGNVSEGIKQSEELHSQLWTRAAGISSKDPHSVAAGLFIQALNEVIDLHSIRIYVGLRSRVPIIIWMALYIIAVVSMGAMGYQGGLSGTRRSPAVLAVAIAFSLVIWLIADLDRPGEGLIQTSQQALVDLRNSMK